MAEDLGKGKNYKTMTCEISASFDGYEDLKHLSHLAKNLRNQAIYAIDSHYNKTGEHLGYCGLYKRLKNSENFKGLRSRVAEHVLRAVDAEYRSYFASLKSFKEGKRRDLPKPPHYSPKGGYYVILQKVDTTFSR